MQKYKIHLIGGIIIEVECTHYETKFDNLPCVEVVFYRKDGGIPPVFNWNNIAAIIAI